MCKKTTSPLIQCLQYVCLCCSSLLYVYLHMSDRHNGAQLRLSYQTSFGQQTFQEHFQCPSWSLLFRTSRFRFNTSGHSHPQHWPLIKIFCSHCRVSVWQQIVSPAGVFLVHFYLIINCCSTYLLINASFKSSSVLNRIGVGFHYFTDLQNLEEIHLFSGAFCVPWRSHCSFKGFFSLLMIHSNCEEERCILQFF